MLLRRDDISPDKPDNYGRSPLWGAASKGHEGVVKILLGRDDVDPDKPNINSRTPLWWAARHGHEGVVKLLLARDVSPDKPDRYGQTPVFWAAENGHKGVIALLQPPEPATPSCHKGAGPSPSLLLSVIDYPDAISAMVAATPQHAHHRHCPTPRPPNLLPRFKSPPCANSHLSPTPGICLRQVLSLNISLS